MTTHANPWGTATTWVVWACHNHISGFLVDHTFVPRDVMLARYMLSSCVWVTKCGSKAPCIRWGQDQMNPFSAAWGDKSAKQPCAKLLWALFKFRVPVLTLEWVKLRTSNLVHGWWWIELWESANLCVTKYSRKGRGQGHMTLLVVVSKRKRYKKGE